MCGIAGQISFNTNLLENRADYIRMSKCLHHRGPDSSGEFLSYNAALGHRRLSVIDPENGAQPMEYILGGEKYIIVYNGELYNTDEIRGRLKSENVCFAGHSDTEVVLKAFAHYGEYCVNMFNGIFAFAVWQQKKRELFFARDRMGVKPLFFTEAPGGFIFASEIKALLAHHEIKPQMDIDSLAEIMLIGPGRTPGCGVFKNIREVKPAFCGTYSADGLKMRPYWQLVYKRHSDSFEETAEKVRFLVTDSVTRQLVSDVPLCTFLSGGLDSSIVSSVSSRYFNDRGQTLKTFSVDYKDNELYFTKSKFQPNSDPHYVDVMAQYLGSEHHRLVIDTDELAGALYYAVDARDLPGMGDVDSSMLLLCAFIKKYGTVALSGECADEIFGGYPWYRDKTVRMTDGFPWAQSTDYRYSFLRPEFAGKIDAADYVYSRYSHTVKCADKAEDLNETDSRMAEMMLLNIDWFMQNLLERKDRMSMYSSLEVRVPFCDYRIVEYLYSVPWEMKDYRNQEKGLLRYAMRDWLPEEVLWRKKSPYPKTHNPGYLKAVSGMLRQVIDDSAQPLHNFIKKDRLENLLTDSVSQPWYGQLMTTPQTIAFFLQFNYWLKKYNVEFVG